MVPTFSLSSNLCQSKHILISKSLRTVAALSLLRTLEAILVDLFVLVCAARVLGITRRLVAFSSLVVGMRALLESSLRAARVLTHQAPDQSYPEDSRGVANVLPPLRFFCENLPPDLVGEIVREKPQLSAKKGEKI